MNEKTQKLTLSDIATFLAPFVDITTCDRTTLRNLRLNHKEVVSKLNQTGRLLLLTIEGETLLVCNAKVYFDLENKRRFLLARFKSVEDALQVGRINMADPKICELEFEQWKATCLDAELKADEWKVELARKQLAAARERIDKLTRELGASAESTKP